jgi:hypothetical protein
MPHIDTKECSACWRVRPAAAYHRDRSKPYGLASQCRDCRRDAREPAVPAVAAPYAVAVPDPEETAEAELLQAALAVVRADAALARAVQVQAEAIMHERRVRERMRDMLARGAA